MLTAHSGIHHCQWVAIIKAFFLKMNSLWNLATRLVPLLT